MFFHIQFARCLFCIAYYLNIMKNRIKELRLKLDLTQEELADKVRIRRETVVFLEQGKYNPSLKLAHDVAMVLKISVDKLFIFD